MTWDYNHTSGLYQCNLKNSSLSFDPHLERLTEQKGWLPGTGIALDYVWTDGEWTCQERIEYDTGSKRYQVGTEKWRDVKENMEFVRYQDLNPRILGQERRFKTAEIPRQYQGKIDDLFKELKKRVTWKN